MVYLKFIRMLICIGRGFSSLSVIMEAVSVAGEVTLKLKLSSFTAASSACRLFLLSCLDLMAR